MAYHEAVVDAMTGPLDGYLKGFGQDAAGEAYALVSDIIGPMSNTGGVYRITRAGAR